jgi:hypothetical protein
MRTSLWSRLIQGAWTLVWGLYITSTYHCQAAVARNGFRDMPYASACCACAKSSGEGPPDCSHCRLRNPFSDRIGRLTGLCEDVRIVLVDRAGGCLDVRSASGYVLKGGAGKRRETIRRASSVTATATALNLNPNLKTHAIIQAPSPSRPQQGRDSRPCPRPRDCTRNSIGLALWERRNRCRVRGLAVCASEDVQRCEPAAAAQCVRQPVRPCQEAWRRL